MILIILYTIFLLFTDSREAAAHCMTALRQWYETMIPALLPMMLMSSILVDTGFAMKLGRICNKTLLRPFHISDSGCYCLIAGLFFGFPMGAKTTSDLVCKNSLSKKEADFLLSFINCIGPMYTLHFTARTFGDFTPWKLLAGTYGIPLLYGACLRYTLYRRECFHKEDSHHPAAPKDSFWNALYDCVPKCGRSILLLGGCMVLFQLSFVTARHLLLSINLQTNLFYPLLELTGGLSLLKKTTPLSAVLFYTTFGGCCCFLQTYTFLKPAGLSMKKYLMHKTILSVCSFLFGLLVT